MKTSISVAFIPAIVMMQYVSLTSSFHVESPYQGFQLRYSTNSLEKRKLLMSLSGKCQSQKYISRNILVTGTRDLKRSISLLYYKNNEEDDIYVSSIAEKSESTKLSFGNDIQQMNNINEINIPDIINLPTHSKRNLNDTPMMNLEMFLGRIAMISAIIMLAVEYCTGTSFSEQFLALL